MSSITNIIQWIIIGILIGVVAILFFTKQSIVKDNKELIAKLNNCMSAPHTIDTIHDTLKIYSNNVFKPTPITKPYVKNNKEQVQTSGKEVSDIKEGICEEWYNEIYSFNGGRFRWKAHIKDCKIEEMAFPEIFCPKEVIYDVKTVDTCIFKKSVITYKAKGHLGIDLNIGLMNFQEFPTTEVVLFWSIKDRIKLNVGGEYVFKHNEFYYKAGIGIYFN